MTDLSSYLDLVRHDLSLLDWITSPPPDHVAGEDFTDWHATILFYMACIYLKAVCQLFGEDVQDHYSLRLQINTRPELLAVAKQYRHLEEASRDARYEGRTFPPQYLCDRLLPKFYRVRDCAVELLEKHNVPEVPKVDPEPFLARLLNKKPPDPTS